MGNLEITQANNSKMPVTNPTVNSLPAETLDHLNSVFSGSVSDKMIEHNGDIDAHRVAVKEKLIDSKPMTVLHFDTHSDMYREASAMGSPADYLNKLAQDNSVNDIYWVIPDEINETKDKKVRAAFFEKIPGDESQKLVMFGNTSGDSVLYIKKNDSRKNAGFTNVEPKDYKKNPEAYRTVNFHRVTMDQLPSFKDKENMFVDIDADYFSNNGDDTIASTKVKFDPKQLEKFAKVLDEKGVKAKLTTMALSPAYCEDGDKQINKFFNAIGDASKVNDLIYRHGHCLEQTDDSKTIVRDSKDPQQFLLLVLDRINNNSLTDKVGELPLNTKSESYKAAVKAAMMVYKVDETSAVKVLKDLDKLDSEKSSPSSDNVIRYMDIEEDVANHELKFVE